MVARAVVAVRVAAMPTGVARVVVARVDHKALALKGMAVHAHKVKVHALTALTTHRATLVMSPVIHHPHASTRWQPTPSVVMVNRVAPKTTRQAVNLTRCAPAWI